MGGSAGHEVGARSQLAMTRCASRKLRKSAASSMSCRESRGRGLGLGLGLGSVVRVRVRVTVRVRVRVKVFLPEEAAEEAAGQRAPCDGIGDRGEDPVEFAQRRAAVAQLA